jgi:hypothetical protein
VLSPQWLVCSASLPGYWGWAAVRVLPRRVGNADQVGSSIVHHDLCQGQPGWTLRRCAVRRARPGKGGPNCLNSAGDAQTCAAGRTFRFAPSVAWSVENNLSLSNMLKSAEFLPDFHGLGSALMSARAPAHP